MRLLHAPFEAEAHTVRRPLLRPLLAVAVAMLVLVALGRWLELRSEALGALGRPLQGAAVHGGLIALGWIIALGGQPGWQGPALRLAAALLGAFALSRLGAWGSASHALLPLMLVWEGSHHPALRRIGLLVPENPRSLLLGLASGAFLGGHLLVSTSQTLGYAVRLPGGGAYLGAVAYDVGANALSAEWLFRGALFSHWWHRWGFWGAAVASTSLGLMRYLLDPWLPRTVEVGAGAVFYLAALGLCASALRAWSGSLLPGYLASLAFFAAYRMLVAW
ncbi:MAG: hypothetical protein A2X52_00270 [Candidatus Rokubacteria bacterium GWC2_70_16]|nr:MAG: hypothetical protein A2X52_00270 [Candidatus Rokubacteria bacterium GWC2_70_16]OGL20216.1 MAG: hypothetical protein A3K12_01590 [Candidatus Rokubacteria bacterium RIFCSPLOWO2_12_FULL_71_19]